MAVLINRLFAFVWRDRLNPKDKIFKVTGWRSALIDYNGYERKRVQFMFSWEK